MSNFLFNKLAYEVGKFFFTCRKRRGGRTKALLPVFDLASTN